LSIPVDAKKSGTLKTGKRDFTVKRFSENIPVYTQYLVSVPETYSIPD
jgi:hypothetical protein